MPNATRGDGELRHGDLQVKLAGAATGHRAGGELGHFRSETGLDWKVYPGSPLVMHGPPPRPRS